MLVHHQSLSQVSQLAFSSLQVVMVKMARQEVSIVATAITEPLAIELEMFVAIILAKTLAVVLAFAVVTKLARKLVTELIESMVIALPFAKEDSKGFKTIEFLLVDSRLVNE